MVLAAYIGVWRFYFVIAFVAAMLVYALFRVISDGIRRLFHRRTDDSDSD